MALQHILSVWAVVDPKRFSDCRWGKSKRIFTSRNGLKGERHPVTGNRIPGRGVPPAGIEPLPRHGNACPPKGGLVTTGPSLGPWTTGYSSPPSAAARSSSSYDPSGSSTKWGFLQHAWERSAKPRGFAGKLRSDAPVPEKKGGRRARSGPAAGTHPLLGRDDPS